MVLVCLPSDALSKHLLSYLRFSDLGGGVSLHGCSSKAQPLLLTLDEGYPLMATPRIPWTMQSMEFSTPEYWSGWPFPSPGGLANPGIEPWSAALLADSLPAEPQGKLITMIIEINPQVD